MPSDSSKPFDPMSQMADMQAMWTSMMSPYKQFFSGGFPLRYETLDPTVQEIAVLAAMHNMASMLREPSAVKATLSAEIGERAKKLAERG